jgi:hypothetical protein
MRERMTERNDGLIDLESAKKGVFYTLCLSLSLAVGVHVGQVIEGKRQLFEWPYKQESENRTYLTTLLR